MSKQKKKVALVTGASRGIGKSIATELLKNGYAVACGFRDNRKGAEELEEAFPHAKGVQIATRDPKSIRKAMAAIQKHFGDTIAIVINNAAIADERPIEE